MRPKYRKEILDKLDLLLSPDPETIKLGIGLILQHPMFAQLNKHYEFHQCKVFYKTEKNNWFGEKCVPEHLEHCVDQILVITKKQLMNFNDPDFNRDIYRIAYLLINWILRQGLTCWSSTFNRSTPNNKTRKHQNVIYSNTKSARYRKTKNYMFGWGENWQYNRKLDQSRLFGRVKKYQRTKHGHRRRN